MSDLSMVNVDVAPWIRHFERQAVKGATPRATYNKHYIVVQSRGEIKDTEHNQQRQEVPPIISPVQQTVEQAEEEIKRQDQGQEVKTEVITQLEGDSAPKRKRHTVKGVKCKVKKTRLIQDILSQR